MMTSNRSVSEMVELLSARLASPYAEGSNTIPLSRTEARRLLEALASSQAQSDDVVERVAKFLEPQIMALAGKDWEWRQNEERKYARRLIEETGLAAIPPAGEPTDAMVKAGAAKVAEMCGHDEAPRGWDRDVARETFKAMARATLNESSAMGGGDGR